VAEGHNVDVRIDYWKELDAAKVDELNAADLVIMSRSIYSHDHSDRDEPTLWNSVTTPLITMNSWVVRSNHWRWMDTTAAVWRYHIMLALDTTHPVFDGVTFEEGNLVIFLDNTVGSGMATFVGSIDVGNGTLIAQTLADHTWIAEWPAGVEFYAGSGQTAGGRRMLFTAGTQERDGPPPTPWGAWNLTAEGEKIFRNAITYMLPAAPEAPAGYLYDGDVAFYTPQGPGSLDGTWDHNNNSDEWDGTGPGEGNPGGVAALVEDGVTFLRIQDALDHDPGPEPSNRKIYLTHRINIGLNGAKLEARIRIATSDPLDNLGAEPWPAGGIGYHIRDDGKGMFGISDGFGIISFSLAKAGEPDFPDATSDMLVMNNLAGTEPADRVTDTGNAGAVAANTMEIADATQWNTISISIAAGGAGTHVVTVSVNGGAAQSFDVTAGTGIESGGRFSYIAIGSSGTRAVTAFDLDYISVQ